MRKYFSLTLVVMAFAAAQLFAVGEARMTGKVIDTQGNPIAGATITVSATEQISFKQTYTSDSNGTFAIFILNGTIRYNFLIEKEGYQGLQEVIKLKLVPEKNEKTFVLGLPSSVVGSPAEAKPDPVVLAYNEGVELLNSEKHEEAIAKFEESIKLNPEFAPGYKTLVITYAHEKNWKKAIELSTKALELNPDDGDINGALAIAYQETGDKAKASEFAQKAPANPTVLFNEAARLINAGKDKDAEPLLKKAIGADEKFAVAYYELGMLYARLGQNADARAALTKYIELDPKSKDAATAKEMLNYVK